ncbi:hypothetical protein [Bacillus safensis]|uniref:hypothetical protein n=1 Tax=Bacillus safensis TaxID=561879 RepID=UPI0005519270|nr:hypothetical protein [Bacillus safensis]
MIVFLILQNEEAFTTIHPLWLFQSLGLKIWMKHLLKLIDLSLDLWDEYFFRMSVRDLQALQGK